MSSFSIHPDTHTGAVHLTVSDLARARRFYEGILGFQPLAEQGNRVALSADAETPLLILSERPGARPKPRRSTGLYHFAILYPDRAALAQALRRLVEAGYPLGGASDHLVSEALYLSDPDGNGIELYRDRPRDEWRFNKGELQMGTEPLDVQALYNEAEGEWRGLPAETRIGHVHLHVAQIPDAERFYGDGLGLELMVRYGGQAAFMAAGGYHHHLGLNTWAGVGAPPPPADAVGLRYFTLLLPSQAEVERVREQVEAQNHPVTLEDGMLRLVDPSQNQLVLLSEEESDLAQRLMALD